MARLTSQLRVRLLNLKDWCIRTATGKPLLPPVQLRDVGPGHFEATGREFLEYFVRYCGLPRTARILEIGCGVGRMALPLTVYLTDGSYVGMDVVGASIRWCQRHITSKYPNFQFHHVDVYNQRYNPHGSLRDEDFRFFHADRSFEFIFLTSVFTHLLPPGTENYLREMERMLAHDGQVFFTVFLLNEEQNTLARKGQNAIDFRHAEGVCRVRDPHLLESAVAYDEAYLFALLGPCGFVLSRPVLYGTWSGRTDGLSFQDIVLVRKRTTTKEVS